jgi:RNA recognition motif-containing protein
MGSAQEAKKAIEMYSDKDYNGRNMVVNEARPKRTDDSRPRKDYSRDRNY